jgi:hypothetical protein
VWLATVRENVQSSLWLLCTIQCPHVRCILFLSGESDDASSKQLHLRFLLNPVRYEPQEGDPTSLGHVVCERTLLEGKADQQRAVGSGTYENFAAQLVRRRMAQDNVVFTPM